MFRSFAQLLGEETPTSGQGGYSGWTQVGTAETDDCHIRIRRYVPLVDSLMI